MCLCDRGYANWTNNAWNIHFYARAYKEPFDFNNVSSIVTTNTLDRATNVFLPNFHVSELQPNEQTNARNLTSAILSLPVAGQQLEFHLKVRPGQNTTSALSAWTGRVVWPVVTDARGEVDGFIPVPIEPTGGTAPWLPDGSRVSDILQLDVHTQGTDTGNSTIYLVPPEGVIVLSDIDDILRVTKIYQPTEGLLNTFARDFVPWLNMPQRFAEWKAQQPDRPYHFHYLTTTPQQATRVYAQFIYNNYPMGSFDTRPLNFTTVEQTFAVRKFLLERILRTFPRRRFVLIGDTTNSDIMSGYPEVAKAYANVQCILLRNTSATDSGNRFPYDTSGFNGLDRARYMFFRTPDDLAGLDFGRGDCVNTTVPQSVTFGWQNLPFGVRDRTPSDGGSSSKAGVEKVWWVVMVAAVALWSTI